MNVADNMRVSRCLHEIIATALDALEDLTKGDPYQTLKPRLNGICTAALEAKHVLQPAKGIRT